MDYKKILSPLAVASLIATGVPVGTETPAAAASERPNILWVTLDHVTFQHYMEHTANTQARATLSAYEKLCSEGTAFTRALSVAPICVPARACMVTGMYPHNNKIKVNSAPSEADQAVALSYKLVSEYLCDAGYSVGWFGKTHINVLKNRLDSPQLDSSSYLAVGYGTPYTNDRYKDYLRNVVGMSKPELMYRQEWGISSGSKNQLFDMVNTVENWNSPNGGNQSAPGYRAVSSGYFETPGRVHESDFLVNLAEEYITDALESNQPFAASVQIWGPHQPYQVPQETKDTVNPELIPEYPSYSDTLSHRPAFIREYQQSCATDSGLNSWEDFQPVIARAYESYSYVENAVKRLLDFLDQKGSDVVNNTIVIYTADHGDAIGSHGGMTDKGGDLAQEIVRIPMVVRWPNGQIPAGVKRDGFVSNLDVTATILDAAGIDPAQYEYMDSKSMLPAARNSQEGRKELMIEQYGHKLDNNTHVDENGYIIQRAIYSGDIKYIATDGDTHELYDLEADPFEMNNLINDPDCAYSAMLMRGKLLEQMEATGDTNDDTLSLRNTLKSMQTESETALLVSSKIWDCDFNDIQLDAPKQLVENGTNIIGFQNLTGLKYAGAKETAPASTQYNIVDSVTGSTKALRIVKPTQSANGVSSHFTLIKSFDEPLGLNEKYTIEFDMSIQNNPGQADYDGIPGDESPRRAIFLKTDNTLVKPPAYPDNNECAVIDITCDNSSGTGTYNASLNGGTPVTVNKSSWNHIMFDVDTAVGSCNVYFNNINLGVKTNINQIGQFGIYGDTAGSGIDIDNIKVTNLKYSLPGKNLVSNGATIKSDSNEDITNSDINTMIDNGINYITLQENLINYSDQSVDFKMISALYDKNGKLLEVAFSSDLNVGGASVGVPKKISPETRLQLTKATKDSYIKTFFWHSSGTISPVEITVRTDNN